MEREYKKSCGKVPHVPHSVRDHLIDSHRVSASIARGGAPVFRPI
jgi:hypothetical protein